MGNSFSWSGRPAPSSGLPPAHNSLRGCPAALWAPASPSVSGKAHYVTCLASCDICCPRNFPRSGPWEGDAWLSGAGWGGIVLSCGPALPRKEGVLVLAGCSGDLRGVQCINRAPQTLTAALTPQPPPLKASTLPYLLIHTLVLLHSPHIRLFTRHISCAPPQRYTHTHSAP